MRRRHITVSRLATLTLLLAACSEPSLGVRAPTGEEAPPPAPETVVPATAIAPTIESIESTVVSFVAPLPSGEMLYVQGDDVMLWRLPPEPSVRLGAAADVGTIHDVVEI